MSRTIIVCFCTLALLMTSSIVKSATYDETLHKAQRTLKEKGYDPGVPDGLWKKKTAEAIKKFQRDTGLAVTGKLDEDTKRQLIIPSASAATQKAKMSEQTTLPPDGPDTKGLYERIKKSLTPFTLEELRSGSQEGESMRIGSILRRSESKRRIEDNKNFVVTVLSALEGTQLTQVVVYLKEGTQEPDFVLAGGGDAGKEILRLSQPTNEEEYKPIGFKKITFSQNDIKEVYTKDSQGKWSIEK